MRQNQDLKGDPVLVQGAQVRSFAEATLQKPDIPVHGIHGRYALALFEAGAKQGQLDKIDTDLKQVLCSHLCTLFYHLSTCLTDA